MAAVRALLLYVGLCMLFLPEALAVSFTVVNRCSFPVWPGVLSGAGTPPLKVTGLELEPGESSTLQAPVSWSGRIWGRTLCFSDSSGKFVCRTGDCGSGTVECAGRGAAPPATLAEFTLSGASESGTDFYDVSVVDGYNLPMLVTPRGGGGPNCSAAGCAADLNSPCPTALRVLVESDSQAPVACKSACEAFGQPRYCCSGEFASADACKPTAFSEFFKNACPRAYSYAFDDPTSTFACTTPADSYAVIFCPSSSHSWKSITGSANQAIAGLLSSASCRMTSSHFLPVVTLLLGCPWLLFA